MPRHLHLSPIKLLQVVALLSFTFVVSGTVNADPITVTGNATITNGQFFGPQGVVSLSGPNFSANVTDFGSVSTFGNFGISPCSRSIGGLNGPCTGASLNFVSTGSDPHGTFTINGTTFNSSVVDSLSLNFQSVSFVIPQNLVDAAAVRITAPFTFTGVAAPSSGPQVSLQGQGTVVLLLTRQTVFGFTGLFLDNAEYTFGSTVSGVTIEAVPEPASLVLMFTGLAGALQVACRRKGSR
jgi:hypothetical protein